MQLPSIELGKQRPFAQCQMLDPRQRGGTVRALMKIYVVSLVVIVLFVAACTYGWYQSTQVRHGADPEYLEQ